MSDFVELLRSYDEGAEPADGWWVAYKDLQQAADEIERLRSELAEYQHREWHWMQAFEELGQDSSAMRQAECIYGDNCPAKNQNQRNLPSTDDTEPPNPLSSS